MSFKWANLLKPVWLGYLSLINWLITSHSSVQPSWVSGHWLLVTGGPIMILLMLWPRNLQSGGFGLFTYRGSWFWAQKCPSSEVVSQPRQLGNPVDSCSFSDHPPHHSPSSSYLAWSTWQRRQQPRTSFSICTDRQISPCTSASGSTRFRLIQLSIPGGHRC